MRFQITMSNSVGSKDSVYFNPQEALIAAHNGVRAGMSITVKDLERGTEITIPQLEAIAASWGR